MGLQLRRLAFFILVALPGLAWAQGQTPFLGLPYGPSDPTNQALSKIDGCLGGMATRTGDTGWLCYPVVEADGLRSGTITGQVIIIGPGSILTTDGGTMAATTCQALASAGSLCPAGQAARGTDEAGNAVGCFIVATTTSSTTSTSSTSSSTTSTSSTTTTTSTSTTSTSTTSTSTSSTTSSTAVITCGTAPTCGGSCPLGLTCTLVVDQCLCL